MLTFSISTCLTAGVQADRLGKGGAGLAGGRCAERRERTGERIGRDRRTEMAHLDYVKGGHTCAGRAWHVQAQLEDGRKPR